VADEALVAARVQAIIVKYLHFSKKQLLPQQTSSRTAIPCAYAAKRPVKAPGWPAQSVKY